MKLRGQHGAIHELDMATFSSSHVRVLLVAGAGFFVDSYDNFIVSFMVPMIAWQYYGKPSLPSTVADGWVKGASTWGILIGQVVFGILGDLWGRKRVYELELYGLIIGALLCAIFVWPINDDPDNALILLAVWRFLLGFAVGGDYPASAIIASEFAPSSCRGRMLAAVFAMQGLGILTGGIMTIIVLSMFKGLILSEGTMYLGYCWRILAGLGVVPALLGARWRLQIPETPRFTIQILGDVERGQLNAEHFLNVQGRYDSGVKPRTEQIIANYRTTFFSHFSQWSNRKILLGCAACWFFVGFGYYSTLLNTPVLFGILGYGSTKSKGNQRVYDDLWNRAVGATLVYLCGAVPGYWLTVLLIDKWGRKPIQILGFGVLTIIFLILAIYIEELIKNHRTAFILLFSGAQFFFNFGPNVTTFIFPAELFPTAIRSTCHGLSAAVGKIGSIFAAQGMSVIAKSAIGFIGLIYTFAACCFAGLLCTLLLPETKGRTLDDLAGQSHTPTYFEEVEDRSPSQVQDENSFFAWLS